jgi:hypothetical protein
MCRILTFWDTKFRFCEEKVWRFHKRYKIWRRCDNIVPDGRGYINVGLTNKDGKKRKFTLHRLVYKAYNPSWDIEDSSMNNFIDHKDRNRINNHIDNLRVVTHQENQFNCVSTKGYTFDKERNKYQAAIMLDRKRIFIGRYNTEDEAQRAYLEAKAKYHQYNKSD